MSAIPVADYLIEFGTEGALGKGGPGGLPAGAKAEDPAAKIEEAYSRGIAQGKAASRTQCEEELRRQRDQFGQQLAAERQAWAAEAGEKLSGQLASGLRVVEQKIADSVANILKPFLGASLRRQAVDELLEVMRGLMSKDQGVSLEICGPDDLLQVIRDRLAGESAAVRFSASEGSDVRVKADHTIVETRLGAWMTKIEQAQP